MTNTFVVVLSVFTLLFTVVACINDNKVPVKVESGCQGPLKILVPLYVYPGATWDTIAANAKIVSTTVIINPNSGPTNDSDAQYTSYVQKLHNAGVDLVGYIHTSWGARPLNDIEREIELYASQYPLLQGIFLDEAATSKDFVPYYTSIYKSILGKKGWKYSILNPGTIPDQAYVNISSQIVTYEDSYTGFASSSNPTYASCNAKDKFAVITYGASVSAMHNVVTTAQNKNYYGWIYVTDGAGGCCTYNNLVSYYSDFAQYVSKN